LAAETSNALDGLERPFARFDVVPVSSPVATAASGVVATLQRAGQTPNDPHDVYIAATARTETIPVLTGDVDHFDRLDDGQVVDWNECRSSIGFASLDRVRRPPSLVSSGSRFAMWASVDRFESNRPSVYHRLGFHFFEAIPGPVGVVFPERNRRYSCPNIGINSRRTSLQNFLFLSILFRLI
jgi:hypothetical protein